MTRLTPISWREFVQRMKAFGFEGPYQEGKHPYMVKGNITVTIPNPHRKEIGVDLLRRVLKQAGISRKEWTQKRHD